MAEVDVTETLGDIDRNKAELEMSAVKKVFGTYELLELIVLNLNVPDLAVVPRVNRAFHNVTTRSKKINKRLVSNEWFESKAMNALYRSVSDTSTSQRKINALCFCTLLGQFSILALANKEVIVVLPYGKRGVPTEPVLLDGDEDIPGLTDNDRALLNKGWLEALKVNYRRLHYGSFCSRLVEGVFQLVGEPVIVERELGCPDSLE
jgi:hypothetical protein